MLECCIFEFRCTTFILDFIWGCCKKCTICWIIVAIAAIVITFFLLLGSRCQNSEIRSHLPIGAVASNGEGCAEIGGKILLDGGSAADAAIATLLCEGVILPHSLGIGGGFIATIYIKETGIVETLIARETAPANSHQDMFLNEEITGAIAAAIPSEIYGFWKLHEKYGKLPWKQLFQPTIDLCIKGHKVSKYLANVLNAHAERLRIEPSMAEIFINPRTNDFYKEDEIMYRPQLGETLRIIAEDGPEVMYRGGRIGKQLVEDIQEMGGIVTEQDLQNYEVRWEQPIVAHFTEGYSLYTSPLPTSGAVLVFILNVIEPMQCRDCNVYWHRVIETFKHAYGNRTNLGDMRFEPQVSKIYEKLTSPTFAGEIRKLIEDNRTHYEMGYYGASFSNVEDHGTGNMVVLAPNGDAISITSTINSHLGAKVRSRRTGIILNDQMDDFSTPGKVNVYGIPASPANYIKPGKIPMSSTCPSIVLDKLGNVKMLVGGAGGSRITTSVAQTILRYFIFNEPIDISVNAGRLHHQLAPMSVDVEPQVRHDLQHYLIRVGHDLNYLPTDKAYSSLTAIGLKQNIPQPVCDNRRSGSAVVVHSRH